LVRNLFGFNKTSFKARSKTVKNVIVFCAAPRAALPAGDPCPANAGNAKARI